MNRSVRLTPAAVNKAEAGFRRRFPNAAPKVALILGSGWGAAAERAFTVTDAASADCLPGWGRAGVAGHAGRLLLAEAGGVPTLIFQGRRHWYEGEGWTPVAIPPLLCRQLGVRALLLTNSSGSLRADRPAGSLGVIRDHLNLMGVNPLQGPHHAAWGPRFPDMTRVYHPAWNRLLGDAGRAAGQEIPEGVYAGVPGPAYETPAEVEMLARLGADWVGMSTVPEAILAHAAGLAVGGLTCVSNLASGVIDAPLDHAAVLAAAAAAQSRIVPLLQHVWSRLAGSGLLSGDRP